MPRSLRASTCPTATGTSATGTSATLTTALVAAAILLTLSTGAVAAEPPTSFSQATTPLALVDARLAPEVDIAALRAEDASKDRQPGPTRFAAAAQAGWSLDSTGTWEELADGSKLWRLRLASPGALSLSVALADLELPTGAKLWLYATETGDGVRGPYGASDVHNGTLFTPVVLGDSAVLELWIPAGDTASLRVDAVHHGYRFFGEREKQGPCNIDIVCPQADDWREQAAAVGTYSINGIFLCTGTMMNNTAQDFAPYFLTADHCGLGPNNVSSLVVYWNYESPTCGALSGGSLNDNQLGASFVSGSGRSDFTLLRLNNSPDPTFGVTYAGWDARGAVPQAVTAIHHPGTDEKAISFENDPVTSLDLLGSGTEDFWRVADWDVGTTEPGSSGSCIFDQTSKLCVGTLTGGLAACGNDLEDWYGKFSQHWVGEGTSSTRLSDWLDPGNTGALFLESTSGCPNGALCLRGGRFQVSVDWRDFDGNTGIGQIVTQSDDSGLLWFFGPDNWELLVKIIDGCSLTNTFWVFSAATTDVEYTLTVTDTQESVSKTYSNPLGRAAPAINDTGAFATCP
ncbi:MAG: trypsin-like peptidase domain-containing protein [Acidobacteriota bacterium]